MRTFFAQVETRYRAIKIARLPRHVLSRFLAVICVLKLIMIIEFGKIKSK